MIEQLYLIWSIEHQGWWRPRSSGYTGHRELAGKYSYKEAREIVDGANRHIKWEHTPDERTPEPKEAMVPCYDYELG